MKKKKKNEKFHHLDARSPKNVNQRPCPRDLFVEIMKPLPRAIRREKARDIEDLTAISKVNGAVPTATARIRAWSHETEKAHDEEDGGKTEGKHKKNSFIELLHI